MNAYTFSDVLIEPKYSEVISRGNVDLSSNVGSFNLKLPIISANMKTITGPKMAVEMALNGGMGILHRFNSIDEAIREYTEVVNDPIFLPVFSKKSTPPLVGVSIGVKEEDIKRFEALFNVGARIFCIDVAHGHHILVKHMITRMRSLYGDKITIIAGNIATKDAAYDLASWGVNAVKVGIGPGSVCTTRSKTGVGIPQLYALEKIAEQVKNQLLPVSIISDGGVGKIGDIPKTLKFADAVMIGGKFAGTSETPGRAYRSGDDDEWYKTYGGSASGENRDSNRFVEGMVKTVPFRGHVKYVLREIEDGLRSAFSYVGASNMEEFKKKCEFIFISGGGSSESKFQ